MDFSFTEEQSMLRDTVASYLADHYSFDQRRAMLAKEPHWSRRSGRPSPRSWASWARLLGGAGRPGRRVGREHDRHAGDGAALVVEPYLGTW